MKEISFDGIIGPTHLYSGLAIGDLNSQSNAHKIANPKAAALEGLNKMALIKQLTGYQGLFIPPYRPHWPLLHNMGFKGSRSKILKQSYKKAPQLLASAFSASSMWVANMATVSPSSDTLDNKVHFTPANLCYHLHRSIETSFNSELLKLWFNDEKYFSHHPPCPFTLMTSDEGAANHSRIQIQDEKSNDLPAINLFVYGRYGNETTINSYNKYLPRQTRLSQEIICRNHMLDDKQCLFIMQNHKAVDAGVFHNDVAAVGHQNTFIYHEKAFKDDKNYFDSHPLLEKYNQSFTPIKITNEQLSLEEALSCYLFNSQIITLKNNQAGMAIIMPQEVNNIPAAKKLIKNIIDNPVNPITEYHFVNVTESLKNGGGPACLRLRIPLTNNEQQAVHPSAWLNDNNEPAIRQWIEKHYRDKLTLEDCQDPAFCVEIETALDELCQILNLGSVYEFQKN